MVNRSMDGDKPQMVREGWTMVQRISIRFWNWSLIISVIRMKIRGFGQ